jgi:tRNA(Ile)-lysidine synthase
MELGTRGWGLEEVFSETLRTLVFSFLPAASLEPPAPPLAIALSGGADSMALTLLADAWARAHGCNIVALTVDHGLRAESRAEAEQVAAWMRARGIAHHILTPPPQPAIRNPQAQARARRYDALAEACTQLGCRFLLLAHHADDQAETVALQRHRGTTPPSRAGMPAVRMQQGLALVRPLLGTRKRTLIAYLRANHQNWVEDPSNASDNYARNRLRTSLTEADILSLWHEAQHAGEMRHTAEVARNAWMEAHARTTHGNATFHRPAWLILPSLERMDYLSHAIRTIGGKPFRPRLAETERLATRLADMAQGSATLGHCHLRWHADAIRITPEHTTRTALDSNALPPHMQGVAFSENTLVSRPFWWFSFPLHIA